MNYNNNTKKTDASLYRVDDYLLWIFFFPMNRRGGFYLLF